MNISNSLLYLLLLYAVLDNNNNISLTTGLIIAFVILLLQCYCGNNLCSGATTSTATTNPFAIFNSLAT